MYLCMIFKMQRYDKSNEKKIAKSVNIIKNGQIILSGHKNLLTNSRC